MEREPSEEEPDSPDKASTSRAKSGSNEESQSVVVAEAESGQMCILASLRGEATRVLRICQTTGTLDHSGLYGVDVVRSCDGPRDWRGLPAGCMPHFHVAQFDSESDALSHFTGASPPHLHARGRALLGCLVVGESILILLAVRARRCLVLPTGESVFTVTESQWLRFPLKVAISQLTRTEAKNLNLLAEFNVEGAYFFSDSADITRPQPWSKHGSRPNDEFVWNKWLRGSVDSVGLSSICTTICCGYAESRTLRDAKGQRFTMALLARRSSLHPGTRYLARGLNEHASPGNEVECELLVWREPRHDETGGTMYSSHVWRRGTVPIWWKQEIKNTVGEAEINVLEHPYVGTPVYFRRLRKIYNPPDNVEGDHEPPVIHCVNLLRCAPGKPEMVLSEHFQEALREARREDPALRADVLNFDWHRSVKSLGQEKAVEGLWSMTTPLLSQMGCTMAESKREEVHEVHCWQTGIMRYNCADSLDRTNLASFFVTMRVLLQQCYQLGIDVRSPSNRDRERRKEQEQLCSSEDLPSGWECRRDPVTGHVFYIDHNTRRTTWQPPVGKRRQQTAGSPIGSDSQDEPGVWPGLLWPETVSEIKNDVNGLLIQVLSELFQGSGDTHAVCYTGTRAMHSSMINLFNNESDKNKVTGANAASNLGISLQRRYANIVSDSFRHQQLEMLLGVKVDQHFPNAATEALVQSVSSPPCGALVKRVPRHESEYRDQLSLICPYRGPTWAWRAPAGMESVELYLQLSCKCVPSMLIIATGDSPETAAPRFVEVHAGEVLGRMTCLLRSTAIPRAWPGAHLIYSLGNDDLPSRFLVVTFTGLEAADADRETLALSPVEVLSKAGKLALSHCRGLVSGESDDDIPLDEFWPAPIAGVHARGTDGGDASCQLLRSLQPHNDSSDWDAQAGPESVSVKVGLQMRSTVRRMQFVAGEGGQGRAGATLNVRACALETLDRKKEAEQFSITFSSGLSGETVEHGLERELLGRFFFVELWHEPVKGAPGPYLNALRLMGRPAPLEVPSGSADQSHTTGGKSTDFTPTARIVRSRVPAKEVANDNGSIELTVGDEPESLSGFRIDSPSTRDSPGGFNQRSHGSNLAVRVFVAEEDSRSYDSFGQPLSPEMNRDPSFTTVGTFTVPGLSERGPLHFDFGRQVVGRRFAFEVAHGTWSLSSVQLYRLSMYHAAT